MSQYFPLDSSLIFVSAYFFDTDHFTMATIELAVKNVDIIRLWSDT